MYESCLGDCTKKANKHEEASEESYRVGEGVYKTPVGI